MQPFSADGFNSAAQALAKVSSVSPCSMERRTGSSFDFNDPTLECLLHTLSNSCSSSIRVIVAMLVISPGKHAEAGGDVACIIERAVLASCGRLEVAVTPLLADSDPRGGLDILCSLLKQRYLEALESA